MELLDIRDALHRIRLEFTQMPELRLTRQQLRRLLDLSGDTCDVAVAALVHSGFLEKGTDGQIRRSAVANEAADGRAAGAESGTTQSFQA